MTNPAVEPSSTFEVFSNGASTVVWGDALHALDAVVEDSEADLIFADPPYNIGKRFGAFLDAWPSESAYFAWCKQWLDTCIRKLTDNGTMYVMASTQAMPLFDLYLRERVEVISRIVWCYDSSGVQARSRFGSLYEPMLHCVKDPRKYTFNADAILVDAPTGSRRKLMDYRADPPRVYNHQKVPGNVWEFPRVRYRMEEYEEHPAQKPERLLERVLLASTHAGDLVVDPFAGTFTASAVAARLGRRSVGIEAQLDYVRIGLRRLELRTELHGVSLARAPKRTARRRV